MKTVTSLVVLGLASLTLAQSWKPGDAVPAFSLKSMEGKRLFLRDLQNGGPFFLYFIRDGDSVNGQAAPWIHRVIKSYSPARARWYGVFTGKPDRATSWQAELNPPYRMLLDEDLQAVRALKIESSPAILLIGADGKVVREWQGYSGYWLKDLNRTLAKMNGRKPRRIDFSRTPSVTQYGARFIEGG